EITDRRGVALATSVDAHNITADPKLFTPDAPAPAGAGAVSLPLRGVRRSRRGPAGPALHAPAGGGGPGVAAIASPYESSAHLRPAALRPLPCPAHGAR
ncbi:hypothetical protein ABT140_19725, partial [Streptomyces californicus]|uniref:hypothetical protein n=1 Tax=Streptomyces californicus TaxID=67351 RepID=UPI003330E778